jgi:hypothetical protein
MDKKFKALYEKQRVFTIPFSENTEEHRIHGKYENVPNDIAIRLNAIMKNLGMLEENN